MGGEPMRAFVSGEDGLLPRKIIERLRDRGCEILNDAMDKTWRPPVSIMQAVGAEVPREPEVDVLDQGQVDRVIALRPDLIVHAAAMVGTDKCILDERLAWRCNVETTFNMARAARESGAKLIYLSSSAVYDPDAPRPYGMYLDASYPPRPRTIYGQTKYLGELTCLQVMELSRLLIVRPSFVYGGVRDTSSTFVRVAKAIVFDTPPVDVLLDGSYRKDFMHVSDFGNLMLGLIEAKATGVLDVVRGRPRRFYEVLTILDEILGREAVRAKMRWSPEGDYMHDHYADGESAWSIAGYRPSVDIEEGVPLVVREFLDLRASWEAHDRGG